MPQHHLNIFLTENAFHGGFHVGRRSRQFEADGLDSRKILLRVKDLGRGNRGLRKNISERGLAIEPYGVDISPALAELARRRLPQWADRIWVGNAVNWRPPGAMRFDYVHILLDCVPGRGAPTWSGTTWLRPFGRARAACWSATTPPIRPRAIRPPPRR